MRTPEKQPAQYNASPWIARVSGWLVASAVAMGTNLVSNDVGYRGVAIIAATGGMGLASVWLRGFRPDSALVVWTVRSLLLVALLAVAAATMLSAAVSGFAVLIAALATFGATLIRSEPAARLSLLSGVAILALGGGFVADGISPTNPYVTSEGRLTSLIMGGLFTLAGMLIMSAGKSFVDFIKELFCEAFQINPFALWGGGVFFALLGALGVARGAYLFGAATILLAAGFFGVLIGYGRQRDEFIGVGTIVVGLAAALGGAAGIADGAVLLGAATAGISVAFISAGAIFLSRRGQLSRLRHWLEAARPHTDERDN